MLKLVLICFHFSLIILFSFAQDVTHHTKHLKPVLFKKTQQNVLIIYSHGFHLDICRLEVFRHVIFVHWQNCNLFIGYDEHIVNPGKRPFSHIRACSEFLASELKSSFLRLQDKSAFVKWKCTIWHSNWPWVSLNGICPAALWKKIQSWSNY